METRRSTFGPVMALVGESLREVAVLVAVFAPLDAIVQDKTLTVGSWAAIMAAVAIIFALGVVLEVRSRWIR